MELSILMRQNRMHDSGLAGTADFVSSLSAQALAQMVNKTVITVGILAPFLESPGPTKAPSRQRPLATGAKIASFLAKNANLSRQTL
jgi:hypothetical protein